MHPVVLALVAALHPAQAYLVTPQMHGLDLFRVGRPIPWAAAPRPSLLVGHRGAVFGAKTRGAASGDEVRHTGTAGPLSGALSF